MSDNRLEYTRTVAARSLYANYTITMVEIGINLFMALYGLSVFLETPKPQRKGRKKYIAASFVITALSALAGSLDMANYFQPLFRSTTPGHWRELMHLIYYKGWKYLLSHIALGLRTTIGDALLVYRCYIICVQYWWITILPMIMTLSALALLIVTVYQPDSPTALSAGSASTFLTLSTNIIVTSFITFRLFRARRSLAKVLPSADMRVYTGVIAILIESAAPLTIFGVIAAIMQRLRPHSLSPGFYVCNSVFQGLFYSFCALSPHMIIFRVTTGRSFTRFPTPKDGVLSNPIQFAQQTAESAFLQSTFNREFGRNPDPNPERGLNSSVDESDQSQTSVIHVAPETWNNGGDIEKAESRKASKPPG